MQQLVVGNIVEGKVTGITKFGAFVDLGDGKTGMVHISEVAPTFVKEIRDFVKENDTVKVKVLSISEDGKISLSTMQELNYQSDDELLEPATVAHRFLVKHHYFEGGNN